jgi:hypothetical protein
VKGLAAEFEDMGVHDPFHATARRSRPQGRNAVLRIRRFASPAVRISRSASSSISRWLASPVDRHAPRFEEQRRGQRRDAGQAHMVDAPADAFQHLLDPPEIDEAAHRLGRVISSITWSGSYLRSVS